MFYILTGLISVLLISLISKDKKLPVYIGVLASFVPFNGIDIFWCIIGVVAAAVILEQLIPDKYF